MIEGRGAKIISEKKNPFWIYLIISLLLGIVCFFILNFLSFFREISCGDGTLEGNCSLNKPYFCSNRALIEKANVCGCPEILEQENNSCVSKYQKESKEVLLNYILRGEKKSISLIVYLGMKDYFDKTIKTIYYKEGESPSRRDFKIRNIEDKEQREILLPLVVEIQNLAENKEDQVRIAVSLVQNIPYGSLDGTFYFGENEINSSRYPYEVLYDMKGVCQEKSELLAFLLKELGYGVSLFYYLEENHEAVGIKCPLEHSLNNTGYCFIETTGPSIISDNERYYIGLGKLSSNPEVFLVSEGETLTKNMYEYKDADTLAKFTKVIEKSGGLNVFQHESFVNIKEKYCLSNL